MHRTDRIIRTQPFRAVLRERTLSLLWLAKRIGFSHAHTRGVACGYEPASARFRAKVAEALELPERDLFFDDHASSSASASEDSDGSINGAGVAVARAYSIAVEVGVAKST